MDNGGQITGPTNIIAMEIISFSYKDLSKVFTSAVPYISHLIYYPKLTPRGAGGLKILPRVSYTTQTLNKTAIDKSLIKPANATLTQGAKNNTPFQGVKNNTPFQDAKDNMLSDPAKLPPEFKFISNIEMFVIIKEYNLKIIGEALSLSKAYK